MISLRKVNRRAIPSRSTEDLQQCELSGAVETSAVGSGHNYVSKLGLLCSLLLFLAPGTEVVPLLAILCSAGAQLEQQGASPSQASLKLLPAALEVAYPCSTERVQSVNYLDSRDFIWKKNSHIKWNF